jgi:hypothetical protein
MSTFLRFSDQLSKSLLADIFTVKFNYNSSNGAALVGPAWGVEVNSGVGWRWRSCSVRRNPKSPAQTKQDATTAAYRMQGKRVGGKGVRLTVEVILLPPFTITNLGSVLNLGKRFSGKGGGGAGPPPSPLHPTVFSSKPLPFLLDLLLTTVASCSWGMLVLVVRVKDGRSMTSTVNPTPLPPTLFPCILYAAMVASCLAGAGDLGLRRMEHDFHRRPYAWIYLHAPCRTDHSCPITTYNYYVNFTNFRTNHRSFILWSILTMEQQR